MDIEKIRHANNIERVGKTQNREKAKPTNIEERKDKSSETNISPIHYRVEVDIKAKVELEKEIVRLSEEIRKIEQQKNIYAQNLAEIRRSISESENNDVTEISIKLKEMNSIKYEIQQIEIERMRLINELKQKIAEGVYKVNSMDIIKKWFE